MENNLHNSDQNQTGAYGGLVDKATSLLNNVDVNKIPDSLKQYGTTAASKVKNLSTTQKVLGGALIAAGAWYLASKSKTNYRANAAHAARDNNDY